MNDDEFLEICETVWMLAEEEKALEARAAHVRAERTTTRSTFAGIVAAAAAEVDSVRQAGDEIADRIEFNRVKRRLLLLRLQDMAAGLR